MREIILNNTFVSSDNSTYTYKFPLGSQPTFEKGDKIALDSLSMYYSWPSITSANGNNTFTYTWPGVASPVTVTLPDGFYTIDDLNAYLQYIMVSNTHYMLTSSGDYVYFLNFSTNSTRYAVQLDVTPVPTTAQAATYSWSLPGSATWSLPAAATYPQITIPATNSISKIIGFTAGTYPPSSTPSPSSTSTYSAISNFTPQVTPVSSVVVTCSLLNNTYSIPNNLLYSFAPNTTYGSQINITPPSKTFVDMQGGKVSEFSITFLDQTFKRLNILDNNVVILLTIASRDEL
jgi:hypothetical protein